jgi:hypothetical protein
MKPPEQLLRAVRWRPQGSPWTIAGVIVGLIAGILVAAMAIPRRQGVETVSGAGTQAVQDVGGEVDTGADVPAAPGGETAADSAVEGEAPGDAPSAPAATPRAGIGATATTAGAVAPGAPRVTTPAANVRGVTPTKIRIGIAIVDISVLRYLGPSYDNGNVAQQWEAMIDDWRRRKLLPVHGRDIELVFRQYNVLQTEEQRAACVRLVDDDRVFMVVGVVFYAVGSECVAREKRTPLLTADGVPDDVYRRGRPFLFSLGVSEGRLLRNWMHWAHRRGVLKGKTIGVYHGSGAVNTDQVNRNIKGELQKLGYTVAATATAPDGSLGGPEDALAVQQFRTAGVDLAILMASKFGFQQQAETQGYKPTYIETDYLFGTSDTTTSNYPPEQWDGTYGMTARRIGETSAGMGMDAEQRACVAAYERYANRKIAPETTEWAYILTACDEGKVILHALRQAGPNLTPQTLVAGLETVSNMNMNRYSKVTFALDKHHGADAQRTVQWQRGCRCWKAIGSFSPLFVP